MTSTPPPTRHGRKLAAAQLTRAYDWRDDAACSGMDGEIWFPVVHTPGWEDQLARAKKICAACPVRQECLEYALDTGQRAGVWGGLSEKERQELRDGPALPGSHMDRCWENQEWIEQQVKAGVSRREIARQLGVGHSTVVKAVAQFERERQYAARQGAASKAVAA